MIVVRINDFGMDSTALMERHGQMKAVKIREIRA